MSINEDSPEGFAEFKEAYEAASGIISTLGMAIIAENKEVIAEVFDDLTDLFINEPVDALDLFKVSMMMCAKNTVDLYENLHPGWRAGIEAELNNKGDN